MSHAKYRSSNARMGVLTINMVLFLSIVFNPRDFTTLILAIGFGSLNLLSMLDCLRQRAKDDN